MESGTKLRCGEKVAASDAEPRSNRRLRCRSNRSNSELQCRSRSHNNSKKQHQLCNRTETEAQHRSRRPTNAETQHNHDSRTEPLPNPNYSKRRPSNRTKASTRIHDHTHGTTASRPRARSTNNNIYTLRVLWALITLSRLHALNTRSTTYHAPLHTLPHSLLRSTPPPPQIYTFSLPHLQLPSLPHSPPSSPTDRHLPSTSYSPKLHTTKRLPQRDRSRYGGATRRQPRGNKARTCTTHTTTSETPAQRYCTFSHNTSQSTLHPHMRLHYRTNITQQRSHIASHKTLKSHTTPSHKESITWHTKYLQIPEHSSLEAESSRKRTATPTTQSHNTHTKAKTSITRTSPQHPSERSHQTHTNSDQRLSPRNLTPPPLPSNQEPNLAPPSDTPNSKKDHPAHPSKPHTYANNTFTTKAQS